MRLLDVAAELVRDKLNDSTADFPNVVVPLFTINSHGFRIVATSPFRSTSTVDDCRAVDFCCQRGAVARSADVVE